MPIEKNQVVLFHYIVRDEQGNEVENSRGGEPNAYLHGHGGIIRGLEDALEGREAGDTFSVTVSPDKAYGARKPDAIQRVPIKHLMGAKRWKPGMICMWDNAATMHLGPNDYDGFRREMYRTTTAGGAPR